jgi:hypothetical protein
MRRNASWRRTRLDDQLSDSRHERKKATDVRRASVLPFVTMLT